MLRMISILGCLMLTISLGAPSAWAVNKVLSLDGDGDYVEIPGSGSLRLSTNQTIEFEVNPRKYHHGWARVVGKGAIDNRNYGVWLWTDLRILYQFGIDGKMFDFWSNTHLSENNWYHIACTYDGSVIRIYINGNLDIEREYVVTPPMTDKPLTIGYAGYHTYFNGFIDEVRIWNIARTQTEIQDNMNQPIENPTSLPNLVGYWNFDSGIADDLSQYENDGDLYGGAHIADVIYVSPDGSPTGDGTKENPYDTIQRGIDESGRKDIVQVLPGIYEENIELLSDLTVFGSGAENTTITASSGNVVTANNVHNVSLSGLTIDGQGTADNGILCSSSTSEMEIVGNAITAAGCGIWCVGLSRTTIEANTVRQNIRYGIQCGDSTDVNINNNIIEDNPDGIVCRGDATISIIKNEIRRNTHNGIDSWDAVDITIQHNTITENINAGAVFNDDSTVAVILNAIQDDGHGLWCAGNVTATINDNLIYNNRGRGIGLSHSSNTTIITTLLIS